MSDQTALKPAARLPENGQSRSAASGVRHGIDDLLHDIVSLGELQAQLVAADVRESAQKARTPVVLLVIGAVAGLGGMPVLLIAFAEALYDLAGLPRWLSYLASGAAAIASAILLLLIAWKQSEAIISVFTRSRTELSENVRWIKYALSRGRRPPR